MAISPPAPLAGAPLSDRLANTQSSPVRELLQIAMRPEVIVAGHSVPLWPSMVAVFVLGGLSVWLWKLTRSGNP